MDIDDKKEIKKLEDRISKLEKKLLQTQKETYSFMEFIYENLKKGTKITAYVCPCKIADHPCMERCTCVSKISSSGCLCCATYGSEEQRKKAANHIVDTLRKIK